MKKFLSFALVLLISGAAFAGDGSSYRQLQETTVVFNNSGSTLDAGDVVVWDLSGTGVTAGTTLGAYVTTTTSASNTAVAGVVWDKVGYTCADQTACVIVTKGPVNTDVVASSVGAGDFVVSSTTAGAVQSAGVAGNATVAGSVVGKALESNAGTAGDVIVYVDVR